MIDPTEHGRNIADQVQIEDAYGHFDVLNSADVWLILDNIHTHLLDHEGPTSPLLHLVEQQIKELEAVYPDAISI